MKLLFKYLTAALATITVASVCISAYAEESEPTLTTSMVCVEPVMTSHADTFMRDLPTQTEISSKYKEYGIGNSSVQAYETAYSVTEPYAMGSLTEASLNEALNTVNFVRFVAGLPEVSLNDEYNEKCQAASLVNAVNGVLSHYPSQPSGMSDELYELGASGAGSSNIGYGYWSIRDSILRGYLPDEDSGNIDRLGHRRWVLNPSMFQTGFGYVKNMTAMYSFDRNREETFADEYVAWPAENTPYEVLGSYSGIYPFSISLGSSYDTPSYSEVTVRVTKNGDGSVFNLNSSNSSYPNNYFNVENNGYGMRKTIIFCIGEIDNNETYTVEIDGIYKDGIECPIKYDVNVFPISNPAPDPDVESPENIRTTSDDGMITLSWDPVENAEKYSVYIYEDNAYKKISTSVTDESYTVKGLTNGKTYQFLVQAYVNGKWSPASKELLVSAAPEATVTAPTPIVTVGNGKIALTWNAVPGAIRYSVYTYEDGKYTAVNTKIGKTNYIIKNLVNGKRYYFLVQANVDGKWSSANVNHLVSGIPVESVIPEPIVTVGNTKIALSWEAIPGAEKYSVYRYEDGKYIRITNNTVKTNIIVKGLENGKEYKFLVQSYINSKWSSASTRYLVSGIPVLSTITSPTVIAGDKQLTINWEAIPGVSRYSLYSYADGEYTKISTTLSTTNYTLKGLTNGVEYSFLVQAYINGKWSSASTKYLVSGIPHG